MSAIILDGELKSALAAVRSLGKAGVLVSVGGPRDTSMTIHSKYANSTFVYPSPYTHQTEFLESIMREAKKLGAKPLVYAFSDATYLSLFTHKETLKEYMTLVFPETQSVEIAYDKAATYSLAKVSGIPTITTYTPVTPEEVQQLGETLVYPAVIKTRRTVTWRDGVGHFGSASFVHSKEELRQKFLALKGELGEEPLIQDFIRGEEYGVEMLAREGKIYAKVTHHRIRSLSPTGGASVLKETIASGPLRDSLETYAETLVTKLSWTGPIMVEFKVEGDTHEPYLMEINGRFWGSLPLSIAAGVDMPALFYKDVIDNERPESVITHTEGVSTRHFFGDVRHLLTVFFGGDKMRKHLYPTSKNAFRNFIHLPKGTKGDIWSSSDPKPAAMEVVDILKRLWK